MQFGNLEELPFLVNFRLAKKAQFRKSQTEQRVRIFAVMLSHEAFKH